MPSPELPPKMKELKRELAKRYKVAFEDFTVREHVFHILKVTDLETLLAGKDPFKNVEEFPFWIRLWESAMILADLMMTTPPRPGQTLLELGAGLGAPGIAAAANGYRVTLSDYEPHILDFERINTAANKLTGVRFKILDWKKPPKMETFDTIIGAEILFRDEFFEPLLNVFRTMLAPDGVIYLAHDEKRKSLKKFLELAEEEYTISAMRRRLKNEDKETTIVLTRLLPRNEQG